jgi:hypothetical protein
LNFGSLYDLFSVTFRERSDGLSFPQTFEISAVLAGVAALEEVQDLSHVLWHRAVVPAFKLGDGDRLRFASAEEAAGGCLIVRPVERACC